MFCEFWLQQNAQLGANAGKLTDLRSPPLDWVQLGRSMGILLLHLNIPTGDLSVPLIQNLNNNSFGYNVLIIILITYSL